MNEEIAQQIDIDKIIASKAGDKSRYVPGFLVNYLKKIVHQDEVNEGLRMYGNCSGVDFCYNVIYNIFKSSYTVHGLDNLDPDGRYIFVSNHPLGGLDGMALISCIGRKFGDVRFVVNDLLMFLKPLAPIFIPVNKFGRMKPENAKAFNEAFASGAQMLYFPAGLCSRMKDGVIADTKWKSTFLKKAKEFDRDVVPVYFEGRNSMFFYRLANIRKKLGIKFNIEMMYLADEMFKQKGNNFNIYFGEPIPVSKLKEEGTAEEWTQRIREISYSLKP